MNSFLKDTIYYKKMEGVEKSGEPSYGNIKKARAKVERKRDKTTDAEGQEITTDHEIGTYENIGLQDLVWLPGADTSKHEEASRPVNLEYARSKFGKKSLRILKF